MPRARILIIDDDPDFYSIIKTVLENRGYATALCGDPAQCEQLLSIFTPDLIILDLMMGGRMEGAVLARRLKSDGGAGRDIPILMLTGVRNQTGFFWLGDPRDPVHLPVDEVMEKPVKPAELAQKVEQLLARKAGAVAGRKRTLLIIDDNPTMRAACLEVLSRVPEYAVAGAQDGRSGPQMVGRDEPDVLLVDLFLPGMDGVDVILNVQKENPGMPVTGITGDGLAVAAAERRLEKRIQWLLKPFTPAELRESVRQAIESIPAGAGSRS